MASGGLTRTIVALACVSSFVLGSCADESPPVAEEPNSDGHAHSHDYGETGENFAYVLGVPGEESAATQTVEIDAAGGFKFSPEKLQVETGDTVTFEVTNVDKMPHELVLGNKQYQELHETQMEAGCVYHDYSDFSVHVNPGDTLSFTWTFQKPGKILYACHLPGHYDKGMFGRLTVS